MTNRLIRQLTGLKNKGQKAVVIYVTAGDPSLEVTRQTLRYCDEAGVDCVELGIPFSDPLADGPVIQEASYRALQKGVHLGAILKLLASERRRGLRVPVVFMSSLNPIYHYGTDRFFKDAARSGADGLILPDLPVHEASEYLEKSRRSGLCAILMATPTSSSQRLKTIMSKSRGFIYYVSLTGVTGERSRTRYLFKSDVERLRAHVRTPVLVGFGISDPSQAHAIARFSDGVIIGSSIVRHLHEYSQRRLTGPSKQWIRAFVRSVKSIRGC